MTQRLKGDKIRKFGLDLVGDVPWGTHLCQFYETKEDLIDILVPYFRAGLETNEFCMWITAEPLNEEEAKKGMEKSMPHFSEYLKRGQIEIVSYKDWYVKDGVFDSDRVLQGWISKLEQALKKGYSGLRLTGNTFWLEKKDWKAFTDYEEAVNDVIGKLRMIAVCTYSLDKCNAHEIIDVIKNHQFALIKRRGKWELIESAEKKRIAEDLLQTEKKFTALYNSMTEGVALHDVVYDDSGKAVDYVIMDVNPAFEKITGLFRKKAVGKKAAELYGTGAPPYLDVYAEVASSGKPASFETYFPPMQKHFNISVFSPSKGKFNTVFYDITERKQIEESLRASEQRWVTTLASIGDAVIASDTAGKITFMNHVAEALTGWALAEALNKPLKEVFNIVNEHTRKEVENPVAKVLEKGLIVGLANHTLLIRKDGTEIPIDDSGAPIKDDSGKISGVVLVFRGIAERRKMEAELSDLAKFSSENPNVLLRLSKDGKLLYSNPASKRLFGNWLENLKVSLPEHWRKNLTEALSSGTKLGFEEQINESTFSFTVIPIVSENYVNVYAEDITERKEMEKELHDSLRASQYRQSEVSALLRASRAVLQNSDFMISARAVFDACKELIGATAGYVALLSDDGKDNIVLFLESGGLPCSVDPSLPMPIRGLRAETYNTGKVAIENIFSSSDYEKLLPKGHVILENVLFAPLTVEKKTLGIIGLANKVGGFTDHDARMALAFGEIASLALMNSKILERLEENEKRLKAYTENLEELVEEKTKQLKDAERLAAIGETAGMIGHDIRNPLQTIIGELYLSKDSLHSLPESEAKQELVDGMRIIEEQAIYINKIVTDLQDYAKPLVPFIENVDFEKIVESVLPTMEIPDNIEVTYLIDEDFPNLKIDGSYMKRILTNLVANAVQAMPNGGKLTINAYCKNRLAFVSVEDTGEGIREKAKIKVFKPLFTTKAKGQGFGLAVVKKLTEALNGTITFESQEGKGTKFIIELPATNTNHQQ